MVIKVETALLKPTDEIDEDRYALFLASEVKKTMRLRDKGARDFKGLTDAQCYELAEMYCRTYRGHYRIMKPVATTAAA